MQIVSAHAVKNNKVNIMRIIISSILTLLTFTLFAAKDKAKSKLWFQGQVENDKPLGKWIIYSKSGEIIAYATIDKENEIHVEELYMRLGKIKVMYNLKRTTLNHFELKNRAIEFFVELVNVNMMPKSTEYVIYPSIVNPINYFEDGKIITYYENGFVSSISVISNGFLNGISKRFHENGKLRAKGKYKSNSKSGRWKYYYSNGKPNETLPDPLILTIKSYFDPPSGIMKWYSPMVFETKVSKWKYFTDEGKLINIEYYDRRGINKEILEKHER
jgi:antitoxin component YwqK of YwqJK toxin-antitoxin module